MQMTIFRVEGLPQCMQMLYCPETQMHWQARQLLHLCSVSKQPACMIAPSMIRIVRLTKDVRSLARQAHEVATNLIIAGLGGLPDLGHHSLPLLLELGVNQADAHVLRHLVHWDELSCDGGHHNLAGLLCSYPAHRQNFALASLSSLPDMVTLDTLRYFAVAKIPMTCCSKW